MSISTSVLADLLQAIPHLRQQIYFKSSLTALSHAMEDRVLAGADGLLVIASFQKERFYRQEAHRYRRIAEHTPQVYVLAAPETDFVNGWDGYETIAFDHEDSLSQEWHLVVIGTQYASCLICRERSITELTKKPENKIKELTNVGCKNTQEMDTLRRFEGIWTFDRQVSYKAAELLLARIMIYRPELAGKIAEAKTEFLMTLSSGSDDVDSDPFVQRLMTYIQASQYKLLKAYRAIAAQERKERLVNSITTAIRQSLHTDEILQVAVQELGQAIEIGRCLIYRCKSTDSEVIITHEFVDDNVHSIRGQKWSLSDNILFREILQTKQPVYINDISKDSRFYPTKTNLNIKNKPLRSHSSSKNRQHKFDITSWLMVPVFYQDRLLGIIELHYCHQIPHQWDKDELELVEAIATQIGVALIQAESYANLEDLNQQLEVLDRTRSNLVAITGHELRTPLSTIQVCLESLASEPDMPVELRQVMLDSALVDAERMRKLVQDFLTLSRLESGRVEWHLESLSLQECVDLALSSIRSRQFSLMPQIIVQVPDDLPLVRADGEWLVEVLAKLLDNACKFTATEGQIIIEAISNQTEMIEVVVTDTGRGIESKRIDAVFDRFYQEEGALRRTAGGTGLGLAICRQIVIGWGGEIWAESKGKDLGSEFHFTLPIAKI